MAAAASALPGILPADVPNIQLASADGVAEGVTNSIIGTATLTGAIAAAVNPVGYAYAQWGYWADMGQMAMGVGLAVVMVCVFAAVACVAVDRQHKSNYKKEVMKAQRARARHAHGRRYSAISLGSSTTDTNSGGRYSLDLSDFPDPGLEYSLI